MRDDLEIVGAVRGTVYRGVAMEPAIWPKERVTVESSGCSESSAQARG